MSETANHIKILNISFRKDFLIVIAYFVFLKILWDIISAISYGEDSLAMLFMYGFVIGGIPFVFIFIVSLVIKTLSFDFFRLFVNRRFVASFISVAITVFLLLVSIYLLPIFPVKTSEDFQLSFLMIPSMGVIFIGAALLEMLLKKFSGQPSIILGELIALILATSVGIASLPFFLFFYQ